MKRESISTNREAKERGRIAYHAKKRNFFPSKKRYKIILIIMGIIAAAFLSTLIVFDILPGDLTLAMVAVMLGALISCSLLFSSEKKYKRIIGTLVAILFAVLFSFTTSFIGNTYAMLSKISDTETTATGPAAKTTDVTEKPFNIYITGIDQWAYEKGEDLERSDVNMLLTINPLTKEVLLTSIPRDTYVELYTAKQMDKLTHTGIYGVEETLRTVEKWLGIDINYYVKMNFTGARDIINAMGGVEVYSPIDFESSIYGYKYHKGINDLNGKQAIYFARERKAFEGQDSARVENQQRVMKAIIKKMTSSTTLLTKYGEIMDAAGEQMQTNLSKKEMSALARMQITDLASWNVVTQKIEGKTDQDYVASLTQTQKFDIYRPSEKSVKSCVNNIEDTMNPSDEEMAEVTKGKSKSFFVNSIKRLMSNESAEESEE